MTDSDYCDNIKDEVFESISDYLSYNGTDYIDTENAHIGTEGIDEFEVVSWDFISSERIRRDDDTVKYHFKYNVELRGTSYEKEIAAHSVRIAELMQAHEHGVLSTTGDKLLIDFITKTTKRPDSKLLKEKYPTVYADVLKTSESRKLKVSVTPT